MKPIYKIASYPKFYFSFFVIMIGLVFIVGGLESEALASLFQQYYKIQKDFVPNDTIQFEDLDPHIQGITDFRIDKTDSHPLEMGQQLRLHVYMTTNEIPKELVVHIFHQDMTSFFTGTLQSDYRGLASELGRVPPLRYGDVYNIQFDLKTPKNQDHYDLNAFQTMTIDKPGTYMAQISEKASNGTIEHYMSPFSVMTIRDSREDWTVQAMQNLIHTAEDQKSASIRAFGMSYIAIGIGTFLSGINLISSSVERIKNEKLSEKNTDSPMVTNVKHTNRNTTIISILNLRPFSKEQKLVIITGFGVIMESFLSYFWLEYNFPQLNQISTFQALFVEIGLAIFIAVVVYVYSTKSEKERTFRLRRQIVSAFDMLCMDFAWFATQRASQSINEEFILKKNLRIFHIQNLIGMLPEKLGTDMSLQIPDFCEKALLSPRILKPLDPTKPISVDYSECEAMILSAKDIAYVLRTKWKI